MRLTTVVPSIYRPLPPAMAENAIGQAIVPGHLPQPAHAMLDKPVACPLSIEEFVQCARMAGAL